MPVPEVSLTPQKNAVVTPQKEPIFKYGVFWKTEAKLKKHEENIKKLYEKDYEKWLQDKGLFNPGSL